MIEKKVSGRFHGTFEEFIEEIKTDKAIIAQVPGTDVVMLNRKGFNNLTDLVAFEFIENWDFGDIIHIASYVGELRSVLFDTDEKTEKEEN